jgi:hypothetical protein
MVRELEIRQKMADAIKREISVPEFVRWIMANDWNVHNDSSPSAANLVYDIHLLLAERDNVPLDDQSFLQELGELNKFATVPVSLTFESSNQSRTIDVEQPSVRYVLKPSALPSRRAVELTP